MRTTVSIIAVCLLLFITASSAHAYLWLQYGSHSYTLTDNWGTWTEAEAEAVSLGGHLVTINDASENTWLTNTFQEAYTRSFSGDPSHNIAWIGYYNDGAAWKWISGESVTYSRQDYPSWPEGGSHAYLHLSNHPYAETWNANLPHDVNYDYNPKGIIEVSSVPLPSALLLFAPGLIGIIGFKKYKKMSI
jgi:hypothetical protein